MSSDGFDVGQVVEKAVNGAFRVGTPYEQRTRALDALIDMINLGEIRPKISSAHIPGIGERTVIVAQIDCISGYQRYLSTRSRLCVGHAGPVIA